MGAVDRANGRLQRLRPRDIASLLVTLLALASAASASLAQPAAARTVKPPGVIEDRYIVVYDRSVSSVAAETDRQERARGFRARFEYRSAIKGFAARLSEGQVKRLRADPDVAYVTPDRTVKASGVVPLAGGEPTPPSGIRRMGAATATTVRQSSGTGVAVIDTGIDLSHPDLNAVGGTNCVTPGAAAQDDNGHGTHVAGTIGARNDGAGVVGVSPGTRLYSVKVLGADGSGSWSQIICGLDWVTNNSARLNIKVVNISLGGPGSNDANCGRTDGDALHQAVCRVSQAGVSQVVAAGNDGWNLGDSPPDVPASYPEVLTVTAMSDSDGAPGARGPSPLCRVGETDDAYASFSNYATRPADTAHMVAAPGVCIRSTWPGGGYNTISGTSMASPHVAGAVALCLDEGGVAGACAGKSTAQVIAHIRGEALARSSGDSSYGFAGDPLRPNSWGDYFGYLSNVTPDTTPPETSLTAGPSGATRATSAELSFASTETGAVFECRLDAGAWEACSSPRSYTGLADGSHNFSVRARDAAGNTDQTPASRTWTVDTAAPDTTIASGPSGLTSDSTPTFALTSSETGAVFECRVDAGAWASCSSPHTTAALADGAHSFEARATDVAGNADATPASRSITVDTRAPSVSLTRPAAALVTGDSTPAFGGIAGTATGDSPTVTVRVYPGTTASGASVQTLTAMSASGAWSVDATAPLADGRYTAQSEQSDSAGNTGRSAAVTFTVDTAAPDTTIASGPSGLTNDSTPTFGLASTEPGSAFECRIDAGAWAACASPHTTTALADGDHTVEARATDAAGNADPTPARRSVTVDATPPETSIASGPTAVTKSRTPTFEFGTTAGGTRFECRIDQAAWAACSSPHRTTELSDGDHTFAVRAVDDAGNPDATPASQSFRVDPAVIAARPPAASSEQADALSETSAVLNGLVNPNGQATTYHFEYGTSSAYGSRTDDAAVGAEAVEAPVSATLSGLAAGTTYHYRLVATNASGTTMGADRAFTTAAPPPPAPPPPPAVPAPPAPPAVTEPPRIAADTIAPRLSVSIPAQRLATAGRRGVRATIACSEACRISARVLIDRATARRLGLPRSAALTVGRTSAALTSAGRKTVAVRLSRSASAALSRVRSLRVTLRTVATDRAGNPRTLERRVTLRR